MRRTFNVDSRGGCNLSETVRAVLVSRAEEERGGYFTHFALLVLVYSFLLLLEETSVGFCSLVADLEAQQRRFP